MSLTPLTPAQVGGSFDEGEIRALHLNGPHVGKVLVYKKNDPELVVAQDANDVLIEGPRLTAPPPPAKPTNTAPPTITGDPKVGSTLTANDGTWTGGPTFAYKWKSNDVPIAGATGKTLVLDSGHMGGSITVEVTGTNAGGSAAVTSAAVGPVVAAA